MFDWWISNESSKIKEDGGIFDSIEEDEDESL
jgi:hypothetical protein